jgi:hypothetical protein
MEVGAKTLATHILVLTEHITDKNHHQLINVLTNRLV